MKAAAGSKLKLSPGQSQGAAPVHDAGGHGFCGWLPIVSPELCKQVCDMSLPAEIRKEAHDRLMALTTSCGARLPASAAYSAGQRASRFNPTAGLNQPINSSRLDRWLWTNTSPNMILFGGRDGGDSMKPNIIVFFSDDHAGWALPSLWKQRDHRAAYDRPGRNWRRDA